MLIALMGHGTYIGAADLQCAWSIERGGLCLACVMSLGWNLLLVHTEAMETSDLSHPLLPELPHDVEARILEELPDRGEKVLACIRTAVTFLEQARQDKLGLRWSESAAYNLREAPEAVVVRRSPAEGDLPTVLARTLTFAA